MPKPPGRLGRELLDAAGKGRVSDVVVALDEGADVNYASTEISTMDLLHAFSTSGHDRAARSAEATGTFRGFSLTNNCGFKGFSISRSVKWCFLSKCRISPTNVALHHDEIIPIDF